MLIRIDHSINEINAADMKLHFGNNGFILIAALIVELFFLTGCEKDFFAPAGTVTDVEGNTYNAVKIGSQTWFQENLKTTKYNNEVPIPNVTDGFQWTVLTTGAYCCYDNYLINGNIYGNLYNWYAVNTGNLCPNGWHVPSDTEWKVLEGYLGGSYNAGGRLKEAGLTHWDEPNYGAINSSGFSALPAGSISPSFLSGNLSQFGGINNYSGFWSSTGVDSQMATERDLNSDDHVLGSSNGGKFFGLSVRCLKDN
jgi:uncharacterized protein (TIGR02145 family)